MNRLITIDESIIVPDAPDTPDAPIPTKTIGYVMDEHEQVRERLKRLGDYAAGNAAITTRTRQSGLPNNRIANAYPRYIATMASGYLIGNPVDYQSKAQEEALESIMNDYDAYNADSVDSELAMQASVFGKGVEVLFTTSDGKARSASVSPLTAFVVYSSTVESKPLFAVRYWDKVDGTKSKTLVDVYTSSTIHHYQKDTDMASGYELLGSQPHFFDGVPVIEYWNNAEERGDFESVMRLIDAYDLVQSDRVNDKQQFTDAILVSKGFSEFAHPADEKDERTPAQRLNEDKLAMLPDNTTSLEWLTKQLSQADTEILKDSLKSDIHKFSMVPDLTDLQFAGNSSGVAMKFKLLGLEQLTKVKERWFREGLRSRLRLFANYKAFRGGIKLDADAVQLTFTRALPANDIEVAQLVETLQGIVPNEILLSRLPFIDDVARAQKSLEKEKEAAFKRQEKLMNAGDYVRTFGGEEE